MDHKPVYQMLEVLTVTMAMLFWPVYNINRIGYVWQGAAAVGVALILTLICYRVFRVDELRSALWNKITARFAPAKAA